MVFGVGGGIIWSWSTWEKPGAGGSSTMTATQHIFPQNRKGMYRDVFGGIMYM